MEHLQDDLDKIRWAENGTALIVMGKSGRIKSYIRLDLYHFFSSSAVHTELPQRQVVVSSSDISDICQIGKLHANLVSKLFNLY